MLVHILKRIGKGESLARIMFNDSLRTISISGKVIDLGGGKHQDYFTYFKEAKDIEVVSFDIHLDPKQEGTDFRPVDFETDILPLDDNSIDAALLFNILEHIYNHQFLINQAYRVLKPGKNITGFVPFLVNYHPDPQDYFRYTRQALERILQTAGFTQIEVTEVGGGPWYVNFNNIVLSFPRVIRMVLFPIYYILDALFLKLRPSLKKRYPLGYLFIGKK